LVGPAAGAALLFTIGPAAGMFAIALFYVPFLVHLTLSPYDGHGRRPKETTRVRLTEVVGILRELPQQPRILVVTVLQGAVGLLVGVALMPLLPEFGILLGVDESGLGYGILLVAMSVGAVAGGLALEASGRVKATPTVSVASQLVFAVAVLGFALSPWFAVSVALLVVAGVTSILALSTSQTVVQLEAPPEKRGRYMGAFNSTNMGFRVGSGLLIGLLAGV